MCFSPVSFKSVDCLLPLLLPGVEVPVERADELHPPLRRTNMMITMMIKIEDVKKGKCEIKPTQWQL